MAAILAVALVLLVLTPDADARITRIVFTRVESPAFGGRVFGAAGPYETLVGTAFGEVDPRDPRNALIQDLALAPRNTRGMIEYATDLYILKPVDLAKGSRSLVYELANRGDKYALGLTFNIGAPWGNDPADPGDGFLQKLGHTIIWSGWQADVLPGDGRMTMRAPVARSPDGSPITGTVRAELIVREPTPTLNLSSGWFTGLRHASYPAVSLDTRTPLADGFLPTLTVRTLEQDLRVPIDSRRWAFGACPDGVTLTPSPTQVCLFAAFRPGRIYELTYRAKEPLVLGLGYAGIRDLLAFFKHERRDDAGTPNPLWMDGPGRSPSAPPSRAGTFAPSSTSASTRTRPGGSSSRGRCRTSPRAGPPSTSASASRGGRGGISSTTSTRPTSSRSAWRAPTSCGTAGTRWSAPIPSAAGTSRSRRSCGPTCSRARSTRRRRGRQPGTCRARRRGSRTARSCRRTRSGSRGFPASGSSRSRTGCRCSTSARSSGARTSRGSSPSTRRRSSGHAATRSSCRRWTPTATTSRGSARPLSRRPSPRTPAGTWGGPDSGGISSARCRGAPSPSPGCGRSAWRRAIPGPRWTSATGRTQGT